MAYQNHKNFSSSQVASPPVPAISGTSLILAPGGGLLFPSPPFNVTIFPSNSQPLASNAEICTVIAIATDTLTLVRTAEGSNSRAILAGDSIANTITAKVITDIEQSLIASLNQIINSSASNFVQSII